MTAVTICQIEPLDTTNYETWKIQMKSVLRYNELWGYVNGNIIKTHDSETLWIINDQKALDLIILNVRPNQLNHIKVAKTSSEAWETFKGIYETKGLRQKCMVYTQLYDMKKHQNKSMSQYLNDFTEKAKELEGFGMKIPSTMLSMILLDSLPEEYKNFCLGQTEKENVPALEELKIELLKEEMKIKQSK